MGRSDGFAADAAVPRRVLVSVFHPIETFSFRNPSRSVSQVVSVEDRDQTVAPPELAFDVSVLHKFGLRDGVLIVSGCEPVSQAYLSSAV